MHITRRRHVLAVAAVVAAAGFTPAAWAHGPTRQKVVETVTIDAPAAKVWEKIRNFDALKDWHPAVAESPSTKANEIGAVRNLKLKGGGALVESLEGWDDKAMKYSYRAKDGGALPVTNYSSTISVVDQGGKAKVEWRGAFYRGYPNNDPPPDQNDEAAVKAVTGVYQSGLANLKKIVEGK